MGELSGPFELLRPGDLDALAEYRMASDPARAWALGAYVFEMSQALPYELHWARMAIRGDGLPTNARDQTFYGQLRWRMENRWDRMLAADAEVPEVVTRARHLTGRVRERLAQIAGGDAAAQNEETLVAQVCAIRLEIIHAAVALVPWLRLALRQ